MIQYIFSIIYMWELNSSGDSIIKNVSNVIIKTNDASRVIVSNENTEIVDKLKTSGGIVGPTSLITYTSDMIGYSFVIDSSNSTFTSGSHTSFTIQIPSPGVWLYTGGQIIIRGNGSFTTSSSTYLTVGNSYGMNLYSLIPSASSVSRLVFPIASGTIVSNSSPYDVTIGIATYMTVGTTTTRFVRLILTRIA